MSYCGECYYEGKKLKPCSNCYEGSEAKTVWTNADAIRAMSDEELAEFLSHYMSCGYCDARNKEQGCKDCKAEILQWLKSEVKE